MTDISRYLYLMTMSTDDHLVLSDGDRPLQRDDVSGSFQIRPETAALYKRAACHVQFSLRLCKQLHWLNQRAIFFLAAHPALCLWLVLNKQLQQMLTWPLMLFQHQTLKSFWINSVSSDKILHQREDCLHILILKTQETCCSYWCCVQTHWYLDST